MMILAHKYEDKNRFGKMPFLSFVGSNITNTAFPVVLFLILSGNLTCLCSNKDLCNSAYRTGPTILLLSVLLLFLVDVQR